MGSAIDPSKLSDSGERCLRRVIELYESGLPGPHLITAYGTAVEVHISEMIDRLIQLSEVGATRLGQELLNKVADQVTATWPNRHHWLHHGFGVAYKGTSAAEDFDTLVHLRNTVVHGDGSWSRNQNADSVQTRMKLRKDFLVALDVAMQDRAVFGKRSREKATNIVRTFVSHFDATLLNAYPAARMAAEHSSVPSAN